MTAATLPPATLQHTTPQAIALAGAWTARAMAADLPTRLRDLHAPSKELQADASGIQALDTAGAWVLQDLLQRLRQEGAQVSLQGLRPEFAKLMEAMAQHSGQAAPAATPQPSLLARVGIAAHDALAQSTALLGFVGESALAAWASLRQPARIRWRPILFNLRTAGLDALPIVGLLAFLLGIVVSFQGANQLRQYGANIFVADLVGLSMLREFAPLITAIILAGRSGSAYAAQIGTMAVSEEIDAMRTLGMVPQEVLVQPKLVALAIAMPLLTVYADVLGVAGGMLMASTQLDVGASDFIDRLAKAVSVTDFLIGVCKAPVFAVIIVVVGCFQGFLTKGGADAVGRQTTRSVVQSIFLVIMADALFSVAFSMLKL